MKKILIITYDWMPRNSIAVHRPYTWAKYWNELGHKITVLTAKKYSYDEPLGLNLPVIESVNVVEVAYRNSNILFAKSNNIFSRIAAKLFSLIKRKSSFLKKILKINYDIRDEWAKKATVVALELHKNTGFELIISTYGPRSCHFIGEAIKSKHPEVVWLADYRDMWSITHSSFNKDHHIEAEKSLEKRIVSKADGFITVSKPLAMELEGFINKKVHVVYNGFDVPMEDVSDKLHRSINNSKNIDGEVNIVYTGMIYPGSRDPSPLFQAINNLILERKIDANKIQVHFFGYRQPGLDQIIQKNSSGKYVRIHGHVAREVALQAQGKADILLLLESGKPEAKGVLTGKIFEYMISGKPILSIGSVDNSAIGDIIAETGVGVVCGADVAKIENFLLHYIDGNIKKLYNPNILNISKYNRKDQAVQLLDIAKDFII